MNILGRLSALVARQPRDNLQEAVINPGCTEFEVNNWIISDFIVNHLVPVVGVHPFPLSELQLMASAVCRLRPDHIFEWGTNIGKSARIFYETVRSFRIPTCIHSIDLPDDVEHAEHPKSDRGKMVRDIKEVNLYTGNGIERSFEIYQKISGNKNVLFFLDGDHSYKSVHYELGFITEKIPEADILLHDTFYQSPGSGYNIGPYKAMQDILRIYPDRFSVLSTQTGLPGMTLLYNKQKFIRLEAPDK